MSPETASLVHHGIFALAIVGWLAAIVAHRRADSAPAYTVPDPFFPQTPDSVPHSGAGTGGTHESTASISGAGPAREGEELLPAGVEDVRARLVDALRGGVSYSGSIRLTEVADRRIRGSIAPITRAFRPASGLSFSIELEEQRDGTRARWTIDGRPSPGLRIASAVFVYLLEPAALVAAFLVMRAFVLDSPDPAVRTQAVQTIHTLHFVWPPFLFAYVSRRLTDAVAAALANRIRNCGF